MTSGLKVNLTVITLEASLKREGQNQLSCLYCLNTLYLEASLWRDFPAAHCLCTLLNLCSVMSGGRCRGRRGASWKLIINRNSQKITCGRRQMMGCWDRRQALCTAAGEERRYIRQMNYEKKKKSSEVLTICFTLVSVFQILKYIY